MAAGREGWRFWSDAVLLIVVGAAVLAGAGAWAMSEQGIAHALWIAATVLAILPAVWWMVAALMRGRAGVDLIAVLSLLGTLVVGEYLAGAVIAVMLATGRVLDAVAQRRATRDLRALLAHAPRTAHRRTGDRVHIVPLAQIAPDDIVVVEPGEVVPVDGRVRTAGAILDEAVLSGEPLPVERGVGDPVRSGVVNAGSAFELRATATADESTYAGIVRLAEQAGAESAPVVRLADRYAVAFLPLTLLVAGAAWLASGSLVRAVAVLVVATPCPLLLAAPVAIVSGISRASRQGVIVRSGAALENLGHAATLVLDKTGTLTAGHPAVIDVLAAPGEAAGPALRLAASLDQLSPHVLAEAIVTEAIARGLTLVLPDEVGEEPGRGVAGVVEGHRVRVGKLNGAELGDEWARAVLGRAQLDSAAIAWIVVDDRLTAAVLLRDPLRRNAARTIRRLRRSGLTRLVMLTGDRPEPARDVGTVLGLDEVCAGQSPADKVRAVQRERRDAVTVMVGDGVNDAPALAAATVGVAMGARGSTASSEAADIVLTTDRLDRLADAMDTARWSRRIAVQSALAGMALSLLAMVVAALGWLPPAPGALLQEGIDVAVILNALRALRGSPAARRRLPVETGRLLHRFSDEHEDLRRALPLVRGAADRLAHGPGPAALAEVEEAYRFLRDRLLPHETAEETRLYPALAGPLGSSEATATMSRTHAEIQRLITRIGTHLELARAGGGIDEQRTNDLLACLYGLHTLLELHFLQEEENYFTLADDPAPEPGRESAGSSAPA